MMICLSTSMRKSSMCTLSKGIVLKTSSSEPSISRLMKSTLNKRFISVNSLQELFLPGVSQGKKEAVQREALDNNSFSCNICQQGMQNLLLILTQPTFVSELLLVSVPKLNIYNIEFYLIGFSSYINKVLLVGIFFIFNSSKNICCVKLHFLCITRRMLACNKCF